MIKAIFVSSSSACFELSRPDIYSGERYEVLLNGAPAGGFNTNVFSIFGLTPNTRYTLKAGKRSLIFTTRSESACLSVTDFGAAGDGKTDDTRAVQTAVNVCPAGGRVLLTRGVYFIKPIVLKSDITLEISEGAALLASPDPDDYPIVKGEVKCAVTGKAVHSSVWEGEPRDGYQSFISLNYARNVNIIGRGLIDGNAAASPFYINPKEQKLARPRLFFANRCENITVHGVACANSASWNYHPFFCKGVQFLDMDVTADKDSPNTDGINPESCENVNIIGVRFSVGDDCIALKSGKMYMGALYQTPCSGVTVRNCYMKHGHGGVVLGSEMSGGIKNLTVEKCLFEGTDRGLRIKTRRGRGKYAKIDNVLFSDIIMRNVAAPFVINMFYFCDPDGKTEYVWSKEKLPVDDRTPYLGRFRFKNIVCTGVEQACGFFYGLPEQRIEEITLENVSFSIAPDARGGEPAMMTGAIACRKTGLYLNNVKRLKLIDVSFSGVEGEEIVCGDGAAGISKIDSAGQFKAINAYIERILKSGDPAKPLWNIETERHNKPPAFNYIDGCMMTAILELYGLTRDRRYLDFADSFYDFYVFEDGSLRGYNPQEYNIDNVCGGRNFFDLYRLTGKEKYLKAIKTLNTQLLTHPRTPEGSFWHKKIYPDQVWLDGLYMAQVFRTRYAKELGGSGYEDIVRQFELVNRHMYNPEKRLYHHGYDASGKAFWCGGGGVSPSFWLRSTGWFLAALIDCIGYMPAKAARSLRPIFLQAMEGIMAYKDAESDMFYQVIDQGGRSGNYLESSGSAMVAYAALKGARLGVLDRSHSSSGADIFYGICRKYLNQTGGVFNLGGICLSAGLGPDSNRVRNGTFEYYISEPVVSNDAKGIAPFLLSYTQLLAGR